MSTDKKRKLQDYLFPEGLYLENNEFRTIKISTILRVIEDKNYCQSIMAAPGSEISNQFSKELIKLKEILSI